MAPNWVPVFTENLQMLAYFYIFTFYEPLDMPKMKNTPVKVEIIPDKPTSNRKAL